MELLELPNEVLVYILEQMPLQDILYSIAKVCVKLEHLCSSKSIWRNVTMDCRMIRTRHLNFEHVEKLTLHGSAPVKDFLYQIKFFKNLVTLYLEMEDLGTLVYADMTTEGDEPKSLGIMIPPTLNEIYFKYKYGHSVVDVKCIKNHRVALDPFHHMLLAVYKFFYVFDQYMDQYRPHNDNALVDLLSIKDQQQYHYTITGFKDRDDATVLLYHRFTQDLFHPFWKEVLYLDLESSSLLDQQMRLVAKCCPNLTSLSIKNCEYVTDIGILYIAIDCPNLETIDLSRSPTGQHGGNITDQGLADLTQACTQLKDINISYCQKVGDLGFTNITRNCPDIHTVRANGCLQLTDKSVVILSSESRHLHTLCIDGCIQLTVVFFSKALTNICIREISTQNCSKISGLNMKITEVPAILSSLSGYRAQSHVRQLTMSFCTQVDDNFLINLSAFCPDLTCVGIRGCHKLTDRAIDVLVRDCTLLEKLDISGGSALQATKLTDASCSSIAEYCRRLKILSIAQNPNITLTTFVDLFGTRSQMTIEVTCMPDGCITCNELNDLATRQSPDLFFSYHAVDHLCYKQVRRVDVDFNGDIFLLWKTI